MSRRYSVGVVTAYGAAKAGGYTGTYSQFCEDLADLGDNIAEVREARIEVDANKTAAQQAQEGAETAQGAAEDAAESVRQSAAQIEQNRQDIGDLKSALDTGYTPANIVFEQGTIRGGVEDDSTTRVRNTEIISCLNQTLYINMPSGYQCYIFYYDRDGAMQKEGPSWISGSSSVVNSYYGLRLIVRKSNQANIAPSDVSPDWFSVLTPFKTACEKSLAEIVGVNLKDYAVGDGVTDDTIALRDAVKAASGGTLYVPNGTYLITGSVTIPSNTKIIGEGSSSVFKLGDGYAIRAVQWRTGKYINYIFNTENNGENISFANFRITGTRTDLRELRVIGLLVDSASHITVDNVSADYINFNPDNPDTSTWVYGVGIFVIRSTNVTIHGGIFHHNGYEHIGTEMSDGVVIDSTFCGTAWRVALQCHQGSKNVKLTNNKVINTDCDKTHALFTMHGQPANHVENIIFANNSLYGRNTSVGHGTGGIQTVEGCEDNIIIANNSIDTTKWGVYNATNPSTPSTIGGWIIIGNIITATNGIRIHAAGGIVIANNVLNVSADTIVCDSTTKSEIGNVIIQT